jgi:hypothetical protein
MIVGELIDSLNELVKNGDIKLDTTVFIRDPSDSDEWTDEFSLNSGEYLYGLYIT